VTCEQKHLLAHFETLQERRAALLEQGATERASRNRAALAREILTLDRQARAAEAQLALLQRLSSVLTHVLAARALDTLSRQLARSLPDVGDLSFSLTSLERALVQQAALAERMDALMALMDGGVEGTAPPVSAPETQEIAVVAHVVDGDTVRLQDGRRVRYVGIDAPEMEDPFGQAEPLAEEATRANRRRVAGRRVQLERDTSEHDRFGRILRHVLVNGQCVGVDLVRAGLARALPLYPDLGRADEILVAEQEARAARRGIWSIQRSM
jgi:endonuclease YncB( thermonuclease family)